MKYSAVSVEEIYMKMLNNLDIIHIDDLKNTS